MSDASSPTRWMLPPEPLRRLVDQPPFPSLLLCPRRRHVAVASAPRHPDLSVLAAPELRLAGLRIDPRAHDRSRREPVTGLSISALGSDEITPVRELPPSPRLGAFSYSPDGSHLAFTHREPGRLELWVADVARREARRVIDAPLSAVLGATYRWMPDGRGFLCTFVDTGREAPIEPPVAAGPVIVENDGRAAPARTYQDLLESPHDEALLAHYATTRLAHVTLDGGVQRLGEPAMFVGVSPSPDGRYLLVETLRQPFSYSVPLARFPSRVEVWSADGAPVARVAELPLADAVPVAFGSVRTGRRWIGWRGDADAELALVEALDGGDAGRDAERRDRVSLLDAPFDGEPRTLIELATRFGGVSWGTDDVALIGEWWWSTRRQKTWIVSPGTRGGAKRLLHDVDWQDRYGAPGSPMTRPTPRGRSVLLVHDDQLYLVGDGASPDGDHPFLDTVNLDTLETARRWQSKLPGYQAPIAMLDPAKLEVILRHESPTDPPNYSITTLGEDRPAGRRAVTRFTDPAPELRDARKTLLRYERADGVELSGTLYTPPGYEAAKDGPLPLLLWAYPRPFKRADTAGQVRAAPHRWDTIWWSSPLVWLTQGVAVLDDPSLPIIGEGDAEPNDTFVEQLVQGATAAVEAVVEKGVADPARIAAGGHSYGAFMTAHLLAHTRLFRAGIARSGSYNRTLTPFGFQSEERNLWEAQEVYREMSVFHAADRIEAPVLLVHGKDDDNPGTFPEQSERLFDALKGLGATVRLVMLPHESHGYRGRQSVMHVLWEMTEWLRVHLDHDPVGPTGR